MNTWNNANGGGIYVNNSGPDTAQAINSNDTFIVTKDGSASGSAVSTGSFGLLLGDGSQITNISTGPQGPQGTTGSQGPTGVQGPNGPQGDQGHTRC